MVCYKITTKDFYELLRCSNSAKVYIWCKSIVFGTKYFFLVLMFQYPVTLFKKNDCRPGF